MLTNATRLPFTIGNLVDARPRRRVSVPLILIAVALALAVASLFLPPVGAGASSPGDEIFIGP